MSDPLDLIKLADTWRARGDVACANELENLVNNSPRAGIWVPLDILEKHASHLIPPHRRVSGRKRHMESSSGNSGDLSTYVQRGDGKHVNSGFVGDMSRFVDGTMKGVTSEFKTALHALHLDHIGTKIHADLIKDGVPHQETIEAIPAEHVKGAYHLGPGLVTNVGMIALANDFAWSNQCNTLTLANFHATGVGATAAASTDIQLLSTTNCPVPIAGTQSLVSAANAQKYQTVATTAYGAGQNVAVTEWGLFSTGTLSSTSGSPIVSATATSATMTGTPFIASSATLRGQQQMIVVNTATGVYGLVLTNTSSVLTIPAWYTISGGLAGATPGATSTTMQPVMFDHKNFGAINTASGDSIVTTYLLTCTGT